MHTHSNFIPSGSVDEKEGGGNVFSASDQEIPHVSFIVARFEPETALFIKPSAPWGHEHIKS